MTTDTKTENTEKPVVGPVFTTTIKEPEARPFIAIDDDRYELGLPDDYSIRQMREWDRKWKFLMNVAQQETVNATQSETYDKYLNECLSVACPNLPESITSDVNFTRSVKMEICFSFLVESARRDPMIKRVSMTSLLQSPSSNDSTTPEIPLVGSTLPLETSKPTTKQSPRSPQRKPSNTRKNTR